DGVLLVGGAALVLLVGLLLAFAFGVLPLPRLGAAGIAVVASLGLLVVWTGVTVAWSIAGDRSWETFNRGVAYVVFLGLGVVLAAAGGARAARTTAVLLATVTGVVLTWALATKALPTLGPDAERIARLQEPVGYWNALALLADVGLALGLWLGATGNRPAFVRVAGGLLTYAATLALLLTLSRAGVVAGIGIVIFWLLVSRERVEGGLLLAAAVVPAGLVATWALTRPALVEDGALEADRVSDGRVFGLLAVVGAGFVAALILLGIRRGLDDGRRQLAVRALLASAAVAAAACLVALAVAIGNPVTWLDEEVTGSSCSEVVNDPSRLGSLNLNNRWCWWNEAVDVYSAHAPFGAGAGTFEIARKRVRADVRSVLQPHSVPLQQLSDGGLVALALFLVLVLAGASVCVGAVRRLEGAERAAAVALVAAPLAFLAHALVDYTWDFVAVTAPTLVAIGVLAGAGREVNAAKRRPFVAVAAILVALVVLVSFASPRIAERSVRGSTRALGEDDFETARDRASLARAFNPLAFEPIWALARIDERQRRYADAEERYAQAVRLQPENPETWLALGLYEFQVRGNLCAAYRFLNDAYTLDPAGSQWVKGGELDVARAAVNKGACEAD
ncbi:MAG: O-antigen ligase family protein, partial [Actinobacteria bacterium]|nr:O-antigen ligase family protein [Actinomycetota bacterium]